MLNPVYRWMAHLVNLSKWRLVYIRNPYWVSCCSSEIRVSFLWELLYADNLAIWGHSLVDLNRLEAWKTSRKSHHLLLNVDQTKILVSSAEHTKISARNPEYPCGVCTFCVGANSILCTSCNKSSGITDHLTDNRNFPVRLYLLLLEPLRKLTSGMTVFMLNPPSNILEIQLINVVVFLTQPLHILSPCGKHSENCYLFSPTVQSEQMLEGMSSTCV